MSSQLPVGAGELPSSERRLYEDRSASLQRRRAEASRVRRRRLALLDLAVASVIAIVGLIAAPGLAILALAALLVLGGCIAWVTVERLRSVRPRGARRFRRRPHSRGDSP